MSRERAEALLAPVVAAFAAAWPGEDVHVIHEAYRVASRCLDGRVRKDGAPSITHPVEVGTIVARFGARREVVCAALLHDAEYPADRLRDEFGSRVAALVHGLLELKADGGFAQADPDVLLLKLADRLHNMRTIRYITPSKQHRKSEETLRVMVPLATSLGADGISRELSDLATHVLRETSPEFPSSPAMRTLDLAAILLPKEMRGRWLTEWAGELAVLPTRTIRAGFVIHLVVGMPRLARTLRTLTDDGEQAHRIPTRTAGPAIAVGTSVAIAALTMSWPTAVVALSTLALTTAILFAKTDQPIRRLRELIDALRR